MKEEYGRSLLVVLVVAVAVVVAQGQPAAEVTVSGSRPLLQALDVIESKIGVPINYEDPRLQHPADVEDVTDEVQSRAQRAANPHGRVIVPKRGELSIDGAALGLQELASQDVLALLTRLRLAHESKGLPGRFVVRQTGSTWTVEPSAARAGSGKLTPVTPVLSRPIAFRWQQRLAAECLAAIAAQTGSASGTKISVGMYPFRIFGNMTVDCGASNEAANVVLNRLFDQVASKELHDEIDVRFGYSYRLTYDPQLRYYLLSVNAVPMKIGDEDQPQPKGTAVRPSGAGAGPGFRRELP